MSYITNNIIFALQKTLMSKIITFSRNFPASHPKAGQPTHFGGMIRNSLLNQSTKPNKHHTIRSGNRWKVGDKFSPRIWSGKPYNSEQILIAACIEIKKIWDFEMDLNCVYSINGKYTDEKTDILLAKNDGLTPEDMQFWFMPDMNKPKEFSGQIICWNKDIIY